MVGRRISLLSMWLLAAIEAVAPAAPQSDSAPPPAVAPVPPTQVRSGIELRIERPAVLEGGRKLEVRRRLAGSAEKLGGNVVSLSIERRVGDGMVYALEASGLVLNQAGDIVTIGSSIEHAGRIAVYFRNAPSLRPRRARVVGIDEATDVGLLSIGPVDLPSLTVAGEPAFLREPAADAAPGDGEARYVVTLFGAAADGEPGAFSLGWLHEPLQDQVLGRRRFDQLLRVTLARSPTGGGGVIAQQDGSVVGLLLQPPTGEFTTGATQPLLALPAAALRRGIDAVARKNAEGTEVRLEPLAPAIAPRAWLGFGAMDLGESEFLGQLGASGAIVVQHVFEGSPALLAGLEPHDVVLAWNGAPIGSVDTMLGHLASSVPGETIRLDVVRRLERREMTLTLGAW